MYIQVVAFLVVLASASYGKQSCQSACALDQCLQQRCGPSAPFVCLAGPQRNQCSSNASFCPTNDLCCDWRTCSSLEACHNRCTVQCNCPASAQFFNPVNGNCDSQVSASIVWRNADHSLDSNGGGIIACQGFV